MTVFLGVNDCLAKLRDRFARLIIHKTFIMIPLEITSRKSSVEDKEVYCLVLPRERLDFEKMCNLIAERTTLEASEVDFVLAVLQDVVIENLEIGRGIELGRLGCLEPSLNAVAVDNIKDVNLKTIKKTRLIYKPSKPIKAALKNMKYSINRRKK